MRHKRKRARTQTRSFGAGKREGHDSASFYRRFGEQRKGKDLGQAFVPLAPFPCNHIWQGDARDMDRCIAEDTGNASLPDNSVALVVTSPPYFAGKEYERDLADETTPSSYAEYLEMLAAVFAQCYRKLEPGGRLAVNVANLGRKPYRSLSGDVIGILNELEYVLSAEIIWRKAQGQSGSCAWGSFQNPASPVIRDVTERIVIAGKDGPGRVMAAREREQRGVPSVATISRDAFLSCTLDLWEFPPEHATRVGHPAPFPIELPRRLMDLYTWQNDLVLDPFMGSGTTAVAALESGRRYAGFEMDAGYVETAQTRIRAAVERVARRSLESKVAVSANRHKRDIEGEVVSLEAWERWFHVARREGMTARKLMREMLILCGFVVEKEAFRVPDTGITVDVLARNREGDPCFFEFCGDFSGNRPGLSHPPSLWETIGKASVLHTAAVSKMAELLGGESGKSGGIPYHVLATEFPSRPSQYARALAQVVGPKCPIRQVFDVLSEFDRRRLWSVNHP